MAGVGSRRGLRGHRRGLGVLRAFLWLGVVVGAALYVVAVMRALGAIREERGPVAPPASPGTTAG